MTESKPLTEKQQQIIIAATEIFAEKGYASTSTSEIAKQAGVAEGTIFRHYKTKKDLLLAIVSPLMLKMIAPFILHDINKVLLHEYERFEDFLRAMIANRELFLRKNMQVIQIFIQEIPFHPELREQFIQHVGSKVYGRFKEIIIHYQQEKQICDYPPQQILRMLASTILGYFVAKYALASNGDWNDEQELDAMINFICKGLAVES